MEVVAEIGSNFKTHQDCVRSIKAAREAGANVVKFQYYDGKELYGPDYLGELSCKPDIELCAREAKFQRIEFMCTAFSPEGYRLVNPFVTRHKIASSEITDLDILETVNSFRKPVILSTGGASMSDIRKALFILRNVPVTLLYCVVSYPARVVDFRWMKRLRDEFGQLAKIGYSDHSLDVLNIPLLAKQHDAVLIEKHVNFTEHTDTPDAPSSLSGQEFALMVQAIKGKSKIEDTFLKNPYQRQRIKLSPGKVGYLRPMPNG